MKIKVVEFCNGGERAGKDEEEAKTVHMVAARVVMPLLLLPFLLNDANEAAKQAETSVERALRGPVPMLPYRFWDKRGLGVSGGLLASERVEEFYNKHHLPLTEAAIRNASLAHSDTSLNASLAQGADEANLLTGDDREGALPSLSMTNATAPAGASRASHLLTVVAAHNLTQPSVDEAETTAPQLLSPFQDQEEPMVPLLAINSTEGNGTETPKGDDLGVEMKGPPSPLLPGAPLAMLLDSKPADSESAFDDILQINTLQTALAPASLVPEWTSQMEKLLEKGLSTARLSVKVAGGFKVPNFIAKSHWPRDEASKHYPDYSLPPYPTGDGVKISITQLFHRTLQRNASRISLVHTRNVSKDVVNVTLGQDTTSASIPKGINVSVVPIGALRPEDLSNISASSDIVPVHDFSMRCEDRSTNRTGMLQLVALTVRFGRAAQWAKKLQKLLEQLSSLPGSGGGCIYRAAAGQSMTYDDVLEVFFKRGRDERRTAERMIAQFKEVVATIKLPLADDSRVGVFREVGRIMARNVVASKGNGSRMEEEQEYAGRGEDEENATD